MEDDGNKGSEIVLLKSELEAAAARVAERALNESWTGTSGFIGDVFGGLVGDRVKQWRTRNLVDALVKTRDHLEKQGVSIQNAKSLPMGEVYTIFDGASKTDDVDLRDMWSALLSNGMNPDKDAFIDPSFSRLLGSLSGLDARILRYILLHGSLVEKARMDISSVWEGFIHSPEARETAEYKDRHAKNLRVLDEFKDQTEDLSKEISGAYSGDHISYSISNLLRLGLLESAAKLQTGRELVKLRSDRYGGNVVADTTDLKNVIKDIRQQIGHGFEVDKKLPTLTAINPFLDRAQVPAYALTGYGQRFLGACT
ncbi:hypothetical protein FHR76_002194 [Rhizobium sp. RAS22]|nr:hypothetical protein [Rhizobium sp. RAS22]